MQPIVGAVKGLKLIYNYGVVDCVRLCHFHLVGISVTQIQLFNNPRSLMFFHLTFGSVG